jgi:LSD1 subclass zinc finger protein
MLKKYEVTEKCRYPVLQFGSGGWAIVCSVCQATWYADESGYGPYDPFRLNLTCADIRCAPNHSTAEGAAGPFDNVQK